MLNKDFTFFNTKCIAKVCKVNITIFYSISLVNTVIHRHDFAGRILPGFKSLHLLEKGRPRRVQRFPNL